MDGEWFHSFSGESDQCQCAPRAPRPKPKVSRTTTLHYDGHTRPRWALSGLVGFGIIRGALSRSTTHVTSDVGDGLRPGAKACGPLGHVRPTPPSQPAEVRMAPLALAVSRPPPTPCSARSATAPAYFFLKNLLLRAFSSACSLSASCCCFAFSARLRSAAASRKLKTAFFATSLSDLPSGACGVRTRARA